MLNYFKQLLNGAYHARAVPRLYSPQTLGNFLTGEGRRVAKSKMNREMRMSERRAVRSWHLKSEESRAGRYCLSAGRSSAGVLALHLSCRDSNRVGLTRSGRG